MVQEEQHEEVVVAIVEETTASGAPHAAHVIAAVTKEQVIPLLLYLLAWESMVYARIGRKLGRKFKVDVGSFIKWRLDDYLTSLLM